MRNYAWLIALGLIAAFHLSTLEVPFAQVDEVADADYALNDDLHLWTSLLPPHQHLFTCIDMPGIRQGYTRSIEQWLRVFGFGLWQLRLLPMVLVFIAWGVLLWFIRQLKLPAAARAGAILFAAGYFFFFVFHQTRHEAFLLLIFLLNISWVFLNGRSAFGVVCGILAGAGWLFHPAVAILFGMMLVMALKQDGPRFLFSIRYWWWFIGMLVGTIIALYTADIEKAAVHTLLAGAVTIMRPPLLEWKWDQWSIFLNGVTQANPYWFRMRDVFHPAFLALSMTAAFWQLRRYREIEDNERILVVLGFGFFTFLSWTNSSTTASSLSYAVYFYPWMFIQLFLVLRKLFLNKMELDAADTAIFLMVHLIVFSTIPGWRALSFWAFAAGVVAWPFMAKKSVKPAWWAALAAVLLLLALTRKEYFFMLLTRTGSLVRNQGWFALIVLVLPLAAAWTFVVRRPVVSFDFKGARRNISVFALYAAMVLTAGTAYEALFLAGEMWKEIPLTRNVRQEFKSLDPSTRVVAVRPLWPYAGKLSFQDLRALSDIQDNGYQSRLIPPLLDYKPDLLLVPEAIIERLKKEAATRRDKVEIELGKIWKTPIGDQYETTIKVNGLVKVPAENEEIR